jgi:predicted ester cyclase
MANQNAVVVRRFVEEYQGTGNEQVALDLLAPDFVDRCPFGPFTPDRDGVIGLFRMLRAGFPDLHAEIHDQLVDGDKVVTRKTFHGTHRGDFMGIAPTGREVAWDVVDIVRVRDGLMVEHWNVVDAMTLMSRIGALPGAA